MKKWIIGRPDEKKTSELAATGGLTELCASVLVSRGVDSLEKAKAFFNENGDSALSNPLLIKDMPEAAERINAAIDSGELICIYGDYDCDGITATVILFSYIQNMGGNVIYHINMREDGYGMCETAVRALSEQGVKLIVTVDNGISAINEAELTYALGMELVVTDHHQPGEVLPRAEAVVDLHRLDCTSPYKDLCGCGVALKLVAALDGGSYDAAIEQYSDLAAIATIADSVPLTGENREIVIQGLHYLANTENAGLQALMSCCGDKKKIDSTYAAFRIVPRINAAGRLGSASDTAELLLCDDYGQAVEKAKALDKLNNDRKEAEKVIANSIIEELEADCTPLFDKVLVICGKNWHHGVIGIVATRLAERFGKPVFLLSDDGTAARGSARSVEGFSIFEALSYCGDILTKFGGHTGAGGFSLPSENVAEFRKRLNSFAAEKYVQMPVYAIHADKLLRPDELKPDVVKSLGLLEPYGECNQTPIFLMHSVRLLEVVPLSGGAHTKLKLTYGTSGAYGLMFGQKTEELPYKEGDMLDMLVKPEINSYKGIDSVNLLIVDIRPCGIKQPQYFNAKAAYERYKRGDGMDAALAERIIPTRDELAVIYRLLPRGRATGCDAVYSHINAEDINYCKFRLGLDIFQELGLVRLDRFFDTAEAVQGAQKVKLADSKILAALNVG